MLAPRYVNELQENAVWVCLSCLWATCAALAWLASTWDATAWEATAWEATTVGLTASDIAAGDPALWLSPQAGASAWTLVALAIACLTFVLRLPILSSPPHTSLASDHVVWLLTTCATVNWLGWLAFQAPTWSDLIPALLLIGGGEVWFHALVCRSNALPWLRQYCAVADVPEAWGGLAAAATLATQPLATQPLAAQPLAATPTAAKAAQPSSDGPCSIGTFGELAREREAAAADTAAGDPAADDGIERRAVAGVDEQGKRYVSGEIKVSLAAGQSTEALSIPFSPPFAGEPLADFECEGAEEDVTVQLIHNTPGGMRVGVRRGASSEAAVFWLQWYAVEVELNESGDVLTSRGHALP